MIGSELYRRQILDSEDDLMRKVWEGTPWMVSVDTGSVGNSGRYREIMDWCRKRFGKEAWPLHGKDGNWYCGSATVFGHTWMGFSSLEMLGEFSKKWVK